MERNIRTLGTETRRCFSDLGVFLRFQKRPRVSLREPLGAFLSRKKTSRSEKQASFLASVRNYYIGFQLILPYFVFGGPFLR